MRDSGARQCEESRFWWLQRGLKESVSAGGSCVSIKCPSLMLGSSSTIDVPSLEFDLIPCWSFIGGVSSSRGGGSCVSMKYPSRILPDIRVVFGDVSVGFVDIFSSWLHCAGLASISISVLVLKQDLRGNPGQVETIHHGRCVRSSGNLFSYEKFRHLDVVHLCQKSDKGSLAVSTVWQEECAAAWTHQ